MQLSNVDVITGYLFGSKDPSRALPVAKALEEELAGGWVGGVGGWVGGRVGGARDVWFADVQAG